MRLLLDTHILLWWILDDPRLTEPLRSTLANAPVVYWSAASSWEVAIKYSLGKLALPGRPSEFLPGQLLRNRITSLSISDNHAFEAGTLPPHHKDPFDRLLIAQARIEQLSLLTDDSVYRLYDVTLA